MFKTKTLLGDFWLMCGRDVVDERLVAQGYVLSVPARPTTNDQRLECPRMG